MAETAARTRIVYPETDGQPLPDSSYQWDACAYAVEAVRWCFRDRPEVCVHGDLFVYVEEGNPDNRVAPDLFVALRSGFRHRGSYRVWEEPGGMPDFALEVLSPSTWRTDVGAKRERYAALGVGEYWLHDPHGRFLRTGLAGHRLVDGVYEPLPSVESSRGLSIRSPVLGLEWCVEGFDLRLVDPASSEYVPTYQEFAGAMESARARIAERDRRIAERDRRIAELEEALRDRRRD